MPMCFSNNEQNISRRTVRSAGKHEPVDSMEALQMTVIDQISNAQDNKEYIRFESRKKIQIRNACKRIGFYCMCLIM